MLTVKHQSCGNIRWRFEHFACCDPHYVKSKFSEGGIAPLVDLWAIAHAVGDAVNFDTEPCFGAVEIHYQTFTERSLTTKHHAIGGFPQKVPHQHFWQRHFLA